MAVRFGRTQRFATAGALALIVPTAVLVVGRSGNALAPAPVAPGAATVSAVADGPRLRVPSGAVRPGEEFVVYGSGFTPRRDGTVSVNGREVGDITTTKGGRFSLRVTVPAGASNAVRVETVVGQERARASVAVAGGTPAPSRTQEIPNASLDAIPKIAPGARSVVVMAVGDLVSSARDKDAIAVRNAVAKQRPARILMLGDYQYTYGSVANIRANADRLWGPKPGGLWRRMLPTAGPTHDATGCGRSDYERYWGRPAMAPYSVNIGSWHVIQLPSAAYRYDCNVAAVTSWLKRDLARHRNLCTLAFFHEPYWTRDTDGHDRKTTTREWVQVLYRAGVDVTLHGHQHNYQRFLPQDPSDRVDRRRGIMSFVVGTGGIGLYDFTGSRGNAATSTDRAYGALKLKLKQGSFDWQFIRTGGDRFSDAGSARCHR